MSWMPKLLLVAASQARTETLHVYEYDASVSPSASTCTREQVSLKIWARATACKYMCMYCTFSQSS